MAWVFSLSSLTIQSASQKLLLYMRIYLGLVVFSSLFQLPHHVVRLLLVERVVFRRLCILLAFLAAQGYPIMGLVPRKCSGILIKGKIPMWALIRKGHYHFMQANSSSTYHCLNGVQSTRIMQFFTRVLVLTSSLLLALYTTSKIRHLRVTARKFGGGARSLLAV